MQSVVGVGSDLVKVSELAQLMSTSGSSFSELSWTRREQRHCAGSTASLAARWAAKEATMKALGHGIGEVAPTDIEIVSQVGERPLLRVRRSALVYARMVGATDFAVSMSHEADFAFAIVIALGADATGGLVTKTGLEAMLDHHLGEAEEQIK